MTSKAVYTPTDEEKGLAKAGEPVSFSLWANNDGNVDIHGVELSQEGKSDINNVLCLDARTRCRFPSTYSEVG